MEKIKWQTIKKGNEKTDRHPQIFCLTKPSFLSQILKDFIYSFTYLLLPPSTWTTKGEKTRVNLWSSLRPPYISIVLPQPQPAPNFLKSGPKSCLKLLDISKKLLKSCLLSKIKMTATFCLLLLWCVMLCQLPLVKFNNVI